MTGRTIETIIMQHSTRGMHLLADGLQERYCNSAATALLNCPRGAVGIATGFYVAGAAETDGPPGSHFLALGLKKLGFDPVILTDRHGAGLFGPGGFLVVEVAIDHDDDPTIAYRDFVDSHAPVAMISVERCGRASDGEYKNMRGLSIKEQTAPIDRWFELAHNELPTFGVGDGGNEIGMGNLAQIIRERLTLDPCIVTVDHLVIASVSNWGAYGILAALEQATGEVLLPTADAFRSYLCHIVELGSVDGISGEPKMYVDGHDISVENRIIAELTELRV